MTKKEEAFDYLDEREATGLTVYPGLIRYGFCLSKEKAWDWFDEWAAKEEE